MRFVTGSIGVTTLKDFQGDYKVRIAKLLVAAATSAAMVVTPAVAQSQTAPRSGAPLGLDARAAAAVDAENELFRNRGRKRRGGGGAFVLIIIAIIIAIGIYIIVDDDDNEAPASP